MGGTPENAGEAGEVQEVPGEDVPSWHITMPLERWTALMKDDEMNLTADEIKSGWHFCWDWDGLLIGPGMMEMECCTCKWEMK